MCTILRDALAAIGVLALAASAAPAQQQRPPQAGQGPQPADSIQRRLAERNPERAAQLFVSNRWEDHTPGHDYARDVEGKRRTDSIYASRSRGVLDYRKLSYRSSVGDLDIPAYLFQPVRKRGPRGHAAMIWVHGGVHGNWGAGMFPFVREAVERDYVIVAPEYRGSTGYGKAFHDAIDYGGYEVDDVISAYEWMVRNLPHVDPERVGIMGWSHGGFIALHSVFRERHSFKAAVAQVPVTNLIFRLSYKGPGYQRSFATQQRIGGLPFEQRELYVERSPYYHVHRLQVPLLVHVATNDDDVNYEEASMLIWALRAQKPELAETRIYVDPPGGHGFARRVNRETLEREDTPEQRDSWNRVWTFLEWHLRPYEDPSKPARATEQR